MRRARNVLLIILTITLVVVGAVLPYGTATMQDRQLASSRDTRELHDIQLLIQQEMNATQVLNFLGGEHTKVAWDFGTNLTAADVKACVFSSLKSMACEDLLPLSGVVAIDALSQGHLEMDVTAFLMISNDESRAALLLWECIWESPDGSTYTVWIDDATEIMCGVSWVEADSAAMDGEANTNAETSAAAWIGPIAIMEEHAEDVQVALFEYLAAWSDFLLEQYGLWTVDYSEIHLDGDPYVITLILSPDGTENRENLCTVQLTVEGANVSFVC